MCQAQVGWRLTVRTGLGLVMAAMLGTHAAAGAAVSPLQGAPAEIVLVDAETVTPTSVENWKQEGFKAVAVVLDERATEIVNRQVARHLSDAGLPLYWWMEVGRNKIMAEAHPRWMATLGMHEDWQKNFPNMAEPKVNQVAKAFPWVPIGYRETFEAHLGRFEQLLKRVPPDWQGLLLNDLQGGPSSCGCGNLQCRWAYDYGMRPTATKIAGDSAAAAFVAEARQRVGNKRIIPVWTTECTEVDLPPEKNHDRPSTRLCGTVGCATGTCPEAFNRQWSALASTHTGPVALLAIHTAFRRTEPEFGGGPGWVTNAVNYLRQAQAAGAKSIPADQLWVVVEGATSEEPAARRAAAQAGVATVIVARIRIDQSYEPRLISK
ncbi:MAG TPA: hypothetical protein VNM37_06020 [Candidatus Dormibacteraeota bacterium]|nr:hypothetical protein [Candidatus Dormibacteraeota bacterium]